MESRADSLDESWRDLAGLIRHFVVEALPYNFELDQGWGQQQRFWAGVELKRDGLRLETKRKWTLRNHGTWRKFSVAPIEPQDRLRVTVLELSSRKAGHFYLEIEFAAPLAWQVRQTQWERGVQLYSMSAEGQATTRLKLGCTLETVIEWGHAPPQLRINPYIATAEITIDDFRIRRISKLGGEVAQQVTRLAKPQLDELAARWSLTVAEKLNANVDRQRDRLLLPLPAVQRLPDFLSGGWLSAEGWQAAQEPNE